MFFLYRSRNLLNKMLLLGLFLMVSTVGQVAAESDKTAIEASVTAFQTIGTLRRQSPIDGNAIAAAYTGVLQTLAQEVDTANSLSLDSNILAAIDNIKADSEPQLAAQVIDKTLQRVFYQSISNRIGAIRDQFQTATSAELIGLLNESEAAFQAIKSTVARANQVLTVDRQALEEGTNPGLDVLVTESFARIRATLNKSNLDEDFANFGVERYVVRMSLARAYYIAVLREVGGVIESRNLDPEETAIEQKEGEIFYRIIESLITRDNPLGNLRIKKQLTGNPSKVVADEIVSELSKGLIGRVKGEMNGQAESIGKDRAHAMAEASGTAAFAKIILPDLEFRLGATQRGNLETALNNLQSASSENSAPKSAEARSIISAILTNYENELNLASYNKTQDTNLIIDGAVVAFQQIGVLRKQFPIDSAAITAEYEGDLQQLTQIIDQIYGTTIDADILAAIAATQVEAQSLQAAQVIDKSLQRIFALTVYNRITLVDELFDELTTDEMTLEWDRAYAAYQAIIGTAARENKVLTDDRQTIKSGSNPDIDDQVTLAFIHGRQALSKENDDDSTQVALARERIVIPLVRSFLIGVLREVEGIIADRDADIAAAKEKQVEGEYFYRIVESFIAQDNPSGSAIIKAQMVGDLTGVVADQVVSEISRGIIGQMNRNLTQAEALLGSDTDQASLAAERVSLYVDVLLPDLELRLGSLQRVELENAVQDLLGAIETSNTTKVSAAKSSITSVITAYHAELN
ncbi:MAG: hypothetical protein LZF61_04735 [Nitrosomonas sp.]|nr:MAG: hypothetical protein LZF61_04735 [Nitrosomonas sp.]